MILIALGARFLNPTVWRRRFKRIVHSRVTTSLMADLVRFSVLPLAIVVNLQGVECSIKLVGFNLKEIDFGFN